MPQLFYHLTDLPASLYDQGACQPFRVALAEWRKLGLGPVVDRVDGNGVLHRLDDGTDRLAVWPAHLEYSPPQGEETRIDIDAELSVSWHGDKAPGPADLDNGNPLNLSTSPLILADGEVWQIPEIREPFGSKLPRDLTRDRKTGRLRTPIKKEYEQLWEETEYWFDLKWQALMGEAQTFDLARALMFATQILSLRYRFCDATQTALRVIDSVNVLPIIETAIGWTAVIARAKELIVLADGDSDEPQKKSMAPSAESVNGSSGPEASDPATDQREGNNG